MSFLWFFLGTMLGGLLGVMFMCLLQINRIDREEHEKQQNKKQ